MKPRKQHSQNLALIIVAFATAGLSPFGSQSARAANVYWDTNGVTADSSGGTTADGTWNATVTGNWGTDPTGASATTDYLTASGTATLADVIFSAGTNATDLSTITLDANNATTGIVARGVTIEEGAITTAATQTGSLVGPLLMLGSGGITVTATANGASSFNLNTTVGLSASQSWTNANATAANTFTAAGGITSSQASGTTVLTLAGANTGTNTLSGIIGNGTSGAVVAVAKSDAGTWLLSGANTYSGGTTSTAGTLLLGNAAGAGTGTITLNGGTFGAAGAQTIANAVVANTGTTTLQGTGTLNLNGILSGSGALSVGASGLALGNTAVNASNASRSGGYTGALGVGGVLGFNSPASANGADYLYNLSNAAVTLTAGGSTQFNAANGAATNNPGVLYVNLGSLSSAAGVGTIGVVNGGTTNTKASRYVVGSLNTDTTFGGVIASGSLGTALTKVGTGTLLLTGSNTYAGTAAFGTFAAMPATTIRGGTVQVGDGTSGSLAVTGALTFLDSGRFNYQSQAAGSSQSLGALTFLQGAGTVQSTYGSSGNTSLTFASLTARTAGATGNFVASGGSNGSTNKIVFTTAPSSDSLLDKGFYFNGTDFASYDSTGFVRALAYGTDVVTSAVDTIASITHVKLTATPAAQDDTSLLTLNLAGSGVSWSSNALQTLSLSGGGLIKSGGGTASAISGGAGLTTGGATELVVRTDTAGDSLDLQTPLLATTTGGLTKTGAGTLTLSAADNAYTGATRINEGALALTGTYTGGGQFIVNNSATMTVTGSLTSTVTGMGIIVGNGSGNGVLNVNSGSTLTLGAASGNHVGLAISNSGTGYDTGSGTVNMNGGTINTNQDITVGLGGCQTGTLNLNSGTINIGTGILRWFKIGQFDTANGVVNVDGGNLNLSFNSDIRFNANSGSGNCVINHNSGNVTSYSGNGTGTAGSATDGLIDMQLGAGSLATNTYNLNGGILTINAIISSQTTATRIFNFNGGTLKAASGSNAANFLKLGAGNTRANVRNGGALIDTNGASVTIAQALLHSNISGDNTTDGGLTQSGTGNLTLAGVNTYVGNTTVSAGTVTLADNAGLKFVIGANGVANKITGAGTATLDGDFTLDLSAASIANGNSWTLVDTTGKAFNSNFTVVGFGDPDLDNKWTKVDGGNTWTFDEADGKLTLAVAAAGYNSWKTANAGGQTADLDFDLDGVKNGVEYFMNSAAGFTSNPSVVVSGATRTVTWTNGGNIPASAYGSQYVVQTSADLVIWTDVPSGNLTTNTSGPGGSLTHTLTGADKSFVRLKVTPN